MSNYETIEIPVTRLGNGREFIALKDAFEVPAVAEFVARFPNYWVFDYLLQGWLGPTNGAAEPQQ